MPRLFPIIAGVFAALSVCTLPARAQLPPGIYAGEGTTRDAAAGTYKINSDHTAVIAKVSHIGYALSVFRFNKVEGSLTWDPAQPMKSTLKALVHTTSITTPVEGFAKELAGKGYLNADQFPDATFVSTAFHPIDASHGQVDGHFTLMGQTRPATFDVRLEGAGKGFMGHPRIGVEARTRINPQDYGLASLFGPTILIEIDAEFAEGS